MQIRYFPRNIVSIFAIKEEEAIRGYQKSVGKCVG